VRIGVLGSARIAPAALMKPAQVVEGVEVGAVAARDRRRAERFGGEGTYVHQLRAFAAAVRGEPANLTPPSDSVATMSLIDDIYTAAGLPLRQ
jgi:predicted dehydrogenase